MGERPIEVTDETFDEVLRKNPNVVIDFWAEWCRPCKALDPVVEQLAKKYAGKIVFGKVDADRNQGKFQEFGVQGIPTILVFRDGKLADQIIGAIPMGPFEARLRKAFDSGTGTAK